MEHRVDLSFDGAVAHVRLDRSDKHNGLDLAMFEALVATGVALQGRRDVRAVVLSGAGPSFCAGLDFPAVMSDPGAMQRLLERTAASPANLAQRVAWVWAELAVPVFAALHGAVYGGGLQIALAADVRYAAPGARLSVMEIRYGLIPDMSLTQTLMRLVRPDLVRELVYTARVVEVAEAQAIGLVTHVVDDPVAAALAAARAVAERSPEAIRAAKRLLRDAPDLDTASALAFETELQLPLLGSPNQLEAVGATMMRRPAVFEDPA